VLAQALDVVASNDEKQVPARTQHSVLCILHKYVVQPTQAVSHINLDGVDGWVPSKMSRNKWPHLQRHHHCANMDGPVGAVALQQRNTLQALAKSKSKGVSAECMLSVQKSSIG
jgi:hypothetical protein